MNEPFRSSLITLPSGPTRIAGHHVRNLGLQLIGIEASEPTSFRRLGLDEAVRQQQG